MRSKSKGKSNPIDHHLNIMIQGETVLLVSYFMFQNLQTFKSVSFLRQYTDSRRHWHHAKALLFLSKSWPWFCVRLQMDVNPTAITVIAIRVLGYIQRETLFCDYTNFLITFLFYLGCCSVFKLSLGAVIDTRTELQWVTGRSNQKRKRFSGSKHGFIDIRTLLSSLVRGPQKRRKRRHSFAFGLAGFHENKLDVLPLTFPQGSLFPPLQQHPIMQLVFYFPRKSETYLSVSG